MIPLFKELTPTTVLTVGMNALMLYVWGFMALAIAVFSFTQWQNYNEATARFNAIENVQFIGRVHHVTGPNLGYTCYVLEDVSKDEYYVNDVRGSGCYHISKKMVTNKAWNNYVQHRESEPFVIVLTGVAIVGVLVMAYPIAMLLAAIICLIWNSATRYIYWIIGAFLLVPLYFALNLAFVSANPIPSWWKSGMVMGEIEYVCVTNDRMYSCPPSGFFNWADTRAGTEIGPHGYTGKFK